MKYRLDFFLFMRYNMGMKHEIAPVYDKNSKILILGSFPSEASREVGFFYGHPNNRFWRVLSRVLEDEAGNSAEEKKAFLLKHDIALWDVIASCTVTGSSDASIRDAVPNDITPIISSADIKAVYLNGKLANRLYEKYIKCDIPHLCLPSTSPANASYTLEKLCSLWSVIRYNL